LFFSAEQATIKQVVAIEMKNPLIFPIFTIKMPLDEFTMKRKKCDI